MLAQKEEFVVPLSSAVERVTSIFVHDEVSRSNRLVGIFFFHVYFFPILAREIVGFKFNCVHTMCVSFNSSRLFEQPVVETLCPVALSIPYEKDTSLRKIVDTSAGSHPSLP